MGSAKSEKLTLLTVESCTAGALACALADAEGAGDVFHGGFVVYSKENKSYAVGVPVEVSSEHTAVSAPLAMAMAVGGVERRHCHGSYGCCRARPDEDGNPVGLVFISAARPDGRVDQQITGQSTPTATSTSPR